MKVIFTYDEKEQLWEATVEGAETAIEARQAFSAVVITAQQLDSSLLRHTRVGPIEGGYLITPAV